mgnify:CR=1 FL=1
MPFQSFFSKSKKTLSDFIQNKRPPSMCSSSSNSWFSQVSQDDSEDSHKELPVRCPTCEQSTLRPNQQLKKHTVSQTLENLTENGVIIPYYTLVHPFQQISRQTEKDKDTGSDQNETDFTNLGVMTTNKQTGKTCIKKAYFSLYGYILDVDEKNQRFMFVSLNDFGDLNSLNGVVNQNVAGLELITAVCNIQTSSPAPPSKIRRYGERFTQGNECNVLFHPQYKADAIWICYDSNSLRTFDTQLNSVSLTTSFTDSAVPKKLFLVIMEVEMCNRLGTKTFLTKFVREMSTDEEDKVKTLIQSYFNGQAS